MRSQLCSGRNIASAAVIALAFVIGACSGGASNGSGSSFQTMPKGSGRTRATVSYTFTTVDNSAGLNNKIMGINDNSEIIGVYYNPGSIVVGNSYVSQPSSGSYTIFTLNNWPDAHTNNGAGGTYMTSLATTANYAQPIAAGYAYDPGGMPGGGNGSRLGVWGVADNQGLWSLIKLHTGQKAGGCIGTQLNGINAAGYSVGEYGDPANSCLMRAFEELPGGSSKNIVPASPSPYVYAATGIDDGLNVVGWLQPSKTSATTKGWYGYPYGVNGCKTKPYCYTVLTYDNKGYSTQLLGINATSAIVGSYIQSGVTHGLLLTSPTNNPSWQTIDEPNAKSITVVNGINDSGDICGWYNDGNGNLHGFVGVPSGGRRAGGKVHRVFTDNHLPVLR